MFNNKNIINNRLNNKIIGNKQEINRNIVKNNDPITNDDNDDCIDLKCIINEKPNIKVVREFFQYQADVINKKTDEYQLMKKFNINI